MQMRENPQTREMEPWFPWHKDWGSPFIRITLEPNDDNKDGDALTLYLHGGYPKEVWLRYLQEHAKELRDDLPLWCTDYEPDHFLKRENPPGTMGDRFQAAGYTA